MEHLREWMQALVMAALLVALVQTLVPEGGLRQVASMVGGLVLLSVLVRPAAWDLGFEGWKREEISQELEQEELLSARIAELTAAYISDKAAQMGISCEAAVETRADENGVPLPWAAELSCRYSAKLAEYMERELAIPAERQVWNGTEH